MPLDARDLYDNLILLCTTHHQLVDTPAHFQTWTTERLVALREDHEAWVASRTASDHPPPVAPTKTDTIYSTLMPVERMVRHVYCADTTARTPKDVPDVQAGRSPLMVPFALRDGRLWAFQDLRDPNNPFLDIIDPGTTTRLEVQELSLDPDSQRLMQQLLNRSLNKLTGRRGLMLDRRHRRYYFLASHAGTSRKEDYQSVTGRKSTLSVVWQPVRKSTNEGRGFWLHRAVSAGFIALDGERWCLAIRPEFHVTKDGLEPYPSDKIGARITRRKARMYNADLLTEIQFWRHYLSEGLPRIVMKFSSKQAIHISSTLMSSTVEWPGIPAKHDLAFTNTEYFDNLFFNCGDLRRRRGRRPASRPRNRALGG